MLARGGGILYEFSIAWCFFNHDSPGSSKRTKGWVPKKLILHEAPGAQKLWVSKKVKIAIVGFQKAIVVKTTVRNENRISQKKVEISPKKASQLIL